MPLRLYLTGKIQLEDSTRVLDERSLPGRQGRRALAWLTLNRDLPVSRDQLAGVIWGEAWPPAWENALSALVSKLRSALRPFGVSVTTAFGAHSLAMPPGSWIDVEACVAAIDNAESLLRQDDPAAAFGDAAVAAAIAERPFLAGEDGEWVEEVRRRLHVVRVRALDVLSDIWFRRGEHALAIEAANAVVRLEPFRDSAYLRLMRAHVAAGDRSEALRVYERCRRLLADELGADPAPETEALYLDLLGPATRA